MASRGLAFVIWAAVAASVVFWGLRLFVRAPQAPAHTAAVGADAAVRADLTTLLGAEPAAASTAVAVAAPAADSRFRLLGVVAERGRTGAGAGAGAGSGAASGRPFAVQGVALIAVDGKPARAFRLGASVEGDTVLQGVSARGATLGPRGGAPSVTLEIPPLPAAATGQAGGVGQAAGQFTGQPSTAARLGAVFGQPGRPPMPQAPAPAVPPSLPTVPTPEPPTEPESPPPEVPQGAMFPGRPAPATR